MGDHAERNKVHKALSFHEEVEVIARFGKLNRVKSPRSRPSAREVLERAQLIWGQEAALAPRAGREGWRDLSSLNRGMPSVGPTLSSRASLVWIQLIHHPVASSHTRAPGARLGYPALEQPRTKSTCALLFPADLGRSPQEMGRSVAHKTAVPWKGRELVGATPSSSDCKPLGEPGLFHSVVA